MDHTVRLNRFFSHFDRRVKSATMEVCKAISGSQADLYILMARKAACFFDCLHELGIVQFNGAVASDRILDMDCQWLSGKKVVIVDDAVISGTTLFELIAKLEKVGVRGIEIYVLCINKQYFNPELLTDAKSIPYIRNPFLELQDQECIKMCADIVYALSKYIRPYSVDFPLFKNIAVTALQFKRLFNTAEWIIDDISTANQSLDGISVLTFSPTELMVERLDESLGIDFSKIAFSKVRIYITAEGDSYNFNILPVVVLKPVYETNVERIFDHFAGHKSPEFRNNFTTSFSKMHFIQYVAAGIVALNWHKSYSIVFKEKVAMVPDKFNDALLFNPFVSDLIFNSVVYHFVNADGGKVFRQLQGNPSDQMAENNTNLPKRTDTPVGMQAALVEPFVSLYNGEELEARKLVYEHKKNVFGMQEYNRILDRLKRGFSVNYLKNIIDSFSLFEDNGGTPGFDQMKFLSLFLDKSIDLGIVVPIVAQKKVDNKTFFYRAYRHGEDVIFGEMEFLLCAFLLDSFIKSQQRTDDSVTRLVAEKLIVLFLKIGIQKNVFVQFISNLPGLKSITTTGVVSIRNYLFGQVATYKDYDEFMEQVTPVYIMGEESKSNWITRKLLQKGLLVNGPVRGYYKVDGIDFTPLDQNKKNETLIIGDMFGELMRSHSELPLKSADLVTLTSCVEPNDIAGSLAAEIVIFNAGWIDYKTFFETNSRNPLNYFAVANGIRSKQTQIFTAVNSGQDKFMHYQNRDAFRIIKRVDKTLSKQNPRDAATWRGFWSPNISSAEEDSSIESLITGMGAWLMKVNLLFRIMEYCLRKIARITPSLLEEKGETYFIDILKTYGSDYDASSQQRLVKSISALNDEHLAHCLTEVEEYRKKALSIDRKLSFITDNFQLEISSLEDFDANDLRTILVIAKTNLDDLYYQSTLLIKDADAIVTPYGKAGLRTDFTQVIYLASFTYKTKKNQLIREVDSLLKSMDGQYFHPRNTKDNFVFMISDGEEIGTAPGLYIFIGGKNSDTISLQAGYELYRSFNGRLVDYMFIFKTLKPVYVVSRTGYNSQAIHYRFFRQMARFFAEHFFHMHGEAVINIVSDKASQNTDQIAFNNILRSANNKELKISRNTVLFADKPFPNEVVLLGYNKVAVTSGRMTGRTKRKPPMKKLPALFEEISECDIGIITIKPTETTALHRHLNDLRDDVRGKSLKKIYSGTLPGDKTTHKIIAMQATDMGIDEGKNIYQIMKNDFNPKLIIVFGTAGGYQDKLKLCDVVIVKKIIDYESGKVKRGKMAHEGRIYNVNPIFKDHYINNFFIKHGGDTIFLDAAKGALSQQFKVEEGVVGCGNKIIEDTKGEIRAWLRTVERKANAFEMESLGAYSSAGSHEVFYDQRTLGVVAIRAITDYGDPNKTSADTEKYREPGLENGMIFLKKFLTTLPDLNQFCTEVFDRRK